MPEDATIVCTNISITDDQISEPSTEETFDVAIELPPSQLNVELGQNPMSTVTILDDDSKYIPSSHLMWPHYNIYLNMSILILYQAYLYQECSTPCGHCLAGQPQFLIIESGPIL